MADDAPDALSTLEPARAAAADREIDLRAGRRLAVFDGPRGEELRITSATGQIEISIRLTPEGPVLSLAAASLELSCARDLTLRAEQIRLEARAIDIHSKGEVRVRAEDDVHVDGALVLINCDEAAPPAGRGRSY